MRVCRLIPLILLALTLAGCGPGAPAPADTAIAAATPEPPATPTGDLGLNPTVVAAVAGTATALAMPSATPEPATATAPAMTEGAPASPTANPELGPGSFPAGVNPLTGLAVPDPAALERRPIAVKVSEFPRGVRPQSGLSLADLVFEHYAEAGITRMTAIFLGSDAPQVGSIRSARLIDLVLAESYDALLVTSGSSRGVMDALRRTSFFDRVIAEATGFDHCPPLCRLGAQPSTHNLFASTADLWRTADALGLNGGQTLAGMAFDPEAPAGGAPAATVHIDFLPNYNVTEWRYDPATARYARWVDTATAGELAAHTDAVNGQALTAANVVVLYANHVTSDIPEDFGNGGHCGYEIQVWTTGPAKVFRDGRAYDATWVRFTTTDVIGLVGADGQALRLKPGNTWFELVNLNSPTTFENGLFSTRFRGPSQQIGCPIT